jgi:hypothetical protein
MQEQNNPLENVFKIKKEYEGKRLPYFGIMKINYSEVGKILTVVFSGDVPTGFNKGSFVFLHQTCTQNGWLNHGEVGLILNGEGVNVNKIDFPLDAAKTLRDIATKYFNHDFVFNINEDLTKFKEVGYYQKNIIKENKTMKITKQQLIKLIKEELSSDRISAKNVDHFSVIYKEYDEIKNNLKSLDMQLKEMWGFGHDPNYEFLQYMSEKGLKAKFHIQEARKILEQALLEKREYIININKHSIPKKEDF